MQRADGRGAGAPLSPVDAMIDALAQGGEAEPGEFTMDSETAREKLRDFQIADPHRSVLFFVQAAVLQGARAIDLQAGTGTLELRFDGRGFSAEELANRHAHAFSRATDPQILACRQLALGLHTASARLLQEIRVVSRRGSQASELVIWPGDKERQGEVAPAVEGTTVLLTASRGGSLQPEQELLARGCLHADAVITLNGDRLSVGLALPTLPLCRPFGDPYLRGVHGLAPALVDRLSLRFVKDGVWITTREVGAMPFGGIAVLDAAALRTDLSCNEIVADDAYQEVERRVVFAHYDLLRWLCGRYLDDPRGTSWAAPALRWLLLRYPPHPQTFQGPQADSLAALAASLPLWRATEISGEGALPRSGGAGGYLAHTVGTDGSILCYDGTSWQRLELRVSSHSREVSLLEALDTATRTGLVFYASQVLSFARGREPVRGRLCLELTEEPSRRFFRALLESRLRPLGPTAP